MARETLKPFRKDVLAKLHAADVSRRRKLLGKQEGRKRLRAVSSVVIDKAEALSREMTWLARPVVYCMQDCCRGPTLYASYRLGAASWIISCPI